MTDRRIVIIGGGGRYALHLTEGIIDVARDQLAGAHVVLLDVFPDNLPFMTEFGNRVAREVGADVTFSATSDQAAAFDGADYLLSQFGLGGHAMQFIDESVPPQFGLQGNETVGIGGIFRTLRAAPILQGMMREAQDRCPAAWIVNYTNPIQMVVDIVQRTSPMRIIGVCDGWVDIHHEVADFLGIETEQVRVRLAGTNHAVWVTELTVDGVDGYPLLRDRLASTSAAELEERYGTVPPTVRFRDGSDVPTSRFYKQFLSPYRFDFQLRLFRLFGLLPGPHYYPHYFFDQDNQIAQQRKPDYVTLAGYYQEVSVPRAFVDLDTRAAQAVDTIRSIRPERRGLSSDYGVHVIAAIENDLQREFNVNVTNCGAITSLPDDAIVELPALIGRDGPAALPMGTFPAPLVGLQHALAVSQLLTVDAALSGDREELLRAIVAHPLVNSLDAAERCMDEMLRLEAEWLPQFRQPAVV